MLSLWTWCVLVVVAVASFLLLVPVAAVTLPFDPNRAVAGRLFRKAAHLGIFLLPLWRFAVRGPRKQKLGRPHVVVSNHESHLDAFLISHLPWEMKWLAKQSLFSLPFIGWSMRLVGDVALVRGERNSTAKALRRCRTYLQGGMSVFLFPEGTRATGPTLQPFKVGAFRLALEANVPLLPLAIAGTRRGLAKGSPWFNRCRALLQVGHAIEPAPYLASHRLASGEIDFTAAGSALAADARLQIAAMREQLEAELAATSTRATSRR